MSLIADALRAAREEKEGRSEASDPDRRARTLFGAVGRRAGGLRAPRPTRWGGFRGLPFVGALVGGGVLVALGFGLYASRAASTAEGMPDASADAVVETTEAAVGLAGPDGSGEGAGDAGGTEEERMAGGGGDEEAVGGDAVARSDAGGDAVASSDDGGSGGDAPAAGERIAAGGEEEGDDAEPTVDRAGRGELHVSVETPEPGVRAVFERAVAAQRAGELEGAAQLYEEALLLDPGNPRIHNNLGTVRRSLGHLRAAREAYGRAVEIAPDYAAAWNNLGIVLGRLGRSGDARAAFEESLRLGPSNVEAKVNLASNYHGEGMYEEARDLLQEAVREDARRPEAHYALARALESLGETTEAIRHYDLFLRRAAGAFPDLEARVREHLRTLRPGGARP